MEYSGPDRRKTDRRKSTPVTEFESHDITHSWISVRDLIILVVGIISISSSAFIVWYNLNVEITKNRHDFELFKLQMEMEIKDKTPHNEKFNTFHFQNGKILKFC